jgi:photosystem II stability/assembly factor-like uncharacterized protein
MGSRISPLLRLFSLVVFGATGLGAQVWEVVTSGADSNLRAISASSLDGTDLGKPVVWAVGSNGTVLVSQGEGKRWKRLTVNGGEQLDFRGIVAFDGSTAYLMASGQGEKSRIYKTSNGGASWELQYSDPRKEFFLDAITCLSEKVCYALGDPIEGKFVVLRTLDGRRWEALPALGLPPALAKEGAFAAGNSCLAIDRDSGIYFVTGGPAARVFHSADAGRTWKTAEVPLAKGNESSGAFSVAVDDKTIVVVGGNYREPGNSDSAAAYSQDGGAAWRAAEGRASGFRSAVAMFERGSYVAVGTDGTDISTDSGAHWKHADSVSLNALTPYGMHGMWGAGAKGTVARFHNPLQHEIHGRPDGQPELTIARTLLSHVR